MGKVDNTDATFAIIEESQKLSTSIYDLVLLHVCHFHHHHHPTFWQFIDYRDTRAFILDPCIQEFLL